MKKSNKKIISAIVIFIVSFLLSLVVILSNRQDFITNVTTDSVGFINKILYIPVKFIEGMGHSITNMLNDHQVNAMSRQNMDETVLLQKEVQTLKQENEQLKKQLNIDYTLSDYEKSTAYVISRTPEMFYEQLIISIGDNEGIKKGMAVLSQGTVVGRVESVANTTAKVLLLFSEKQPNLSVMITLENGEYVTGVLNGYDVQSKEYIVSNIESEAAIKVGNQVLTSGFSQLIPSKLLVGEVTSVGVEEISTFKQVRIKSTTNINDIQYVTVVKKALESVTNE